MPVRVCRRCGKKYQPAEDGRGAVSRCDQCRDTVLLKQPPADNGDAGHTRRLQPWELWAIVGGGVVCLALVALIGGLVAFAPPANKGRSLFGGKHVSAARLSAVDVVGEIGVATLGTAYNTRIRADGLYTGNPIVLRDAIVISTSKTADGALLVVSDFDYTSWRLECFFDSASDIESLHTSQMINVAGVCIGLQGKEHLQRVTLKQCRVLTNPELAAWRVMPEHLRGEFDRMVPAVVYRPGDFRTIGDHGAFKTRMLAIAGTRKFMEINGATGMGFDQATATGHVRWRAHQMDIDCQFPGLTESTVRRLGTIPLVIRGKVKQRGAAGEGLFVMYDCACDFER